MPVPPEASDQLDLAFAHIDDALVRICKVRRLCGSTLMCLTADQAINATRQQRLTAAMNSLVAANLYLHLSTED